MTPGLAARLIQTVIARSSTRLCMIGRRSGSCATGWSAARRLGVAAVLVAVLIGACQLTPEANGRDASEAEPVSLAWTAEAEARLENIPPFARRMARAAVEDYARQRGYLEVTPEIMTAARDELGL